MKLYFTRRSLSLLTVSLVAFFCSSLHADLVVEIGDAEVDLSPGVGTVLTTFDIVFSNPTQQAQPIAGYTLFLDIGPAGQALPDGVTFASDPAIYLSGIGAGGPLFAASLDGSENLDPAAGDIGLGQLQFIDGFIEPDESFVLVQVNLLIDLAVATPGDFSLFLNPDGQSSISSLSNPNQPFSSTSGTLSLAAVPEPNAVAILGGLVLVGVSRRKRRFAL